MKARLNVRPLTRGRWEDLGRLFGRHGAYDGCWCMWWRVRHSEFGRRTGEQNRRSLRRMAGDAPAAGLIGYPGAELVA